MKKIFPALLVCVSLTGGCATTGQLKDVKDTGQRNEKNLHRTEQRLSDLEQNVSGMDKRLDELHNRAYEVRTSGGRRTGMKIVPLPEQSKAVSVSAAALETSKTPPERIVAPALSQTAPILKPSVPPLVLPENASAKDSLVATGENSGKQLKTAGPSGSLGAPPDTAPLASPSADALANLPSSAPLPATIERKTVVRNPLSASKAETAMPPVAAADISPPASADFALPPEYPTLPPAAAPKQDAAAMPTTPPAAPSPLLLPVSGNAVPGIRGKSADKNMPKAAQGEETAYKAALKLAMSGRPAESINLFRDFLQQYPDGRYAANAEYWIGECLYAQRNYQDALAQFQLVNTRYAAHHKNADALLKAGMTLAKLGDKQGAVDKYRNLITAFPNSEAAGRAREMGLVR
ncbi:MAG: tol-pal system protein YbgF [Desulfovibrio sp.]|nr:tol-pal system protein YbgF [Desulfovibrio sp.]